MEWAHVLTIFLPVMFAILIGVFYNNRRIDDLRSDVNHRFDDLRSEINEKFADTKDDMSEIKGMHMEFP